MIQVISNGGGANLQSKSATLTSTSAQTFSPDSGYDGISSITVKPNLQTKSVTPSTTTKMISPDSGYSGLSQISVNGSSNLISSNIKSGVNIFGVVGTLQGRLTKINGNAYASSSTSLTLSFGATYSSCDFISFNLTGTDASTSDYCYRAFLDLTDSNHSYRVALGARNGSWVNYGWGFQERFNGSSITLTGVLGSYFSQVYSYNFTVFCK